MGEKCAQTDARGWEPSTCHEPFSAAHPFHVTMDVGIDSDAMLRRKDDDMYIMRCTTMAPARQGSS